MPNNKHDVVYELQCWLRAISRAEENIPLINADGIYGTETEECVTAYQDKNNLPSTGIVNYDTWEYIYNHYKKIMFNTSVPSAVEPFSIMLYGYKISKGEQFSLVYILQVMLESLQIINKDYTDIDINGMYDEATDLAVRKFQKINHLPVTDYVDKLTWDRLCSVYNQYLSEKHE